MAFNKNYLYRVGSDFVPGSKKHWDYLSTDTITGAGYIPADVGVVAGDQIRKIAVTLTSGLITGYVVTDYYAVADADGVLTLTQLTTVTSPAASAVVVDDAAFEVIEGSTAQTAFASADAALDEINTAITIDGAAFTTLPTSGTLQEYMAAIDTALGS